MPTLECSSCGTSKEFPSRLTVVDEDIDGWELEFEEQENKLLVTDVYCRDCQNDA